MWALALSESCLVSASLDASILVRSFLPADVRAAEAEGRLGRVAGEDDDSSDGSEGEGVELDSAYSSEAEEGDSEVEGEEEEVEMGGEAGGASEGEAGA